MPDLFLVRENPKLYWAVGRIGLFVTLALTGSVRANDLPSASTDTPAQTAPSTTTIPDASTEIQSWWKLTGSYSFLNFHADNSDVPAGFVYSSSPLEGTGPPGQCSLRSSFDLPNHVSIDVGERFVDKIAGANGYCATDVRVAWKPNSNWEVSVVGQNLLESNHVENPGFFGDSAYVGPEVYGKVTFKF